MVTTSAVSSVLVLVLLTAPPGKPRDRANAEPRDQHFTRYVGGGFTDNAASNLGISVKYSSDSQGNGQQGVAIVDFSVDSKAQKAGLKEFDTIVEVEGCAVGLIRGRHYEPFQFYKTPKTELLIAFTKRDGTQGYFYPTVSPTPVERELFSQLQILDHKSRLGWIPPTVNTGLPEDYFRAAKPDERELAEDRVHHLARYVVSENNAERFARYDIGSTFSYTNGAKVITIESGKAAALAGIKVGDEIFEVDGAPVGAFSGRTYQVWRQLNRSKTGKVELLVVTPQPNGDFGYYYPILELLDISLPN